MPQFENPNFPLSVTEEEDGSFTLEWDENHPVTSMFNTWTQEDFTKAIIDRCKEILREDIEDAE